VYTMLPVSLDCPFLIVPLVFSNVYFVHFCVLGISCQNKKLKLPIYEQNKKVSIVSYEKMYFALADIITKYFLV